MQDAKAPAKEPEPVIRLAIQVEAIEFDFTEEQAEDTITRLKAGIKALKAKAGSGT